MTTPAETTTTRPGLVKMLRLQAWMSAATTQQDKWPASGPARTDLMNRLLDAGVAETHWLAVACGAHPGNVYPDLEWNENAHSIAVGRSVNAVKAALENLAGICATLGVTL